MIKQQCYSGTGSADDPTQSLAPVQAKAFHVQLIYPSVPVDAIKAPPMPLSPQMASLENVC